VWSRDGGKAWSERLLGSTGVALEQSTVVDARRQLPDHDAAVA